MTFLMHWLPSLGGALVLTIVAFVLWSKIRPSVPDASSRDVAETTRQRR